MVEENKNPDFIITSGERKWHVHRDIMSKKSSFFDAACNGQFKESKEGIVPLDADEPAVIEAMLKYIYMSKYSDEGASNLQEAIEPLVFNMCMYIIADKYNIYSLAGLATEKFKTRAKTEWNTPAFADVVQEVYSTNCSKLREIVVEIAGSHAKVLYSEDYGTRFREVANEVPAFGSEVAQKLVGMGARSDTKKYTCPGCLRSFEIIHIECPPNEDYWCVFCGYTQNSGTWTMP